MNNLQDYTYGLINNILQVRYTDLEQEIALCEELLQISLERNHPYGIAFAHTYLGDAYIGLDNTAKAMNELELARTCCKNHEFDDILLKVHFFMGTCALMMYDEHSAVNHYLLGLELADALADAFGESIILNNIASIFDKHRDMEEAMDYYQKAYHLLTPQLKEENKSYFSILLYNLVNCCCYLERYREARNYLKELRDSEHDNSFHEIALACAWYIYAMATNHRQLSTETVRQILLLDPDSISDKYFTFEILIPVLEGMLEIENEEAALQILKILERLSRAEETNHQKLLMKYYVKYCKTFSAKDELFKAYEKFFDTANDHDEVIHQMITSGLKDQIHLEEIKREHEIVQRMNLDLEKAANLDETTHLYNRRYFNRMVHRLKTEKSAKKVGIILLDVDYFKEYNDFYGHICGDEILRTVASCLLSCAADNIYACRHGGDEFACLCIDKEYSALEKYLTDVRQLLDSHQIAHQNSACSDTVTFSAGYYNCDITPAFDITQLLNFADQALYRAKGSGRNQFCRFDGA